MSCRMVTRGARVLVVVLAACAGSTEPDASHHGLTVETRPGLLVLGNAGARDVQYVGVVSGALALVTGPEEWTRLASGTTAELRNDQLIAYTPGATHAVILWAVDGRVGDPLEVTLR